MNLTKVGSSWGKLFSLVKSFPQTSTGSSLLSFLSRKRESVKKVLTNEARFYKICNKKKALKKRSIYFSTFREKNSCCEFFKFEDREGSFGAFLLKQLLVGRQKRFVPLSTFECLFSIVKTEKKVVPRAFRPFRMKALFFKNNVT